MQQLQEQEAADAKAAADGKAIKKKKEIVVADKEISVEERASAALSQADLRMLELAELAKKAADQGIVPFYGCSRCRYSRGGCISYNCNPKKFEEHLKKFPEKYEGKKLKIAVEDHELLGGGHGAKVAKVWVKILRISLKTYFFRDMLFVFFS